jgi:uncharacterized protein
LSQLGNCAQCGKLFVRVRNICPDCIKKQEEEFLTVAAYLREHHRCTLQELSEETKVSISRIRKFILDGRIILTDLPNLQYPCESCGAMIRKGKVCDQCLQTITQLAEEAEKRSTENKLENKTYGYKAHISDRF